MVYTILALILTTVYLISKKRYRWFYIIYKTIRRDLKAGVRFVVLNFHLWRFQQTNRTVAKVFTKLAATNPHKAAIYFEDEIWTFQEVENYSNKVAHFFKKEGYQRGDAVALTLDNRPEYVCLWLGLAKIGVVTALINNNLVADPLIHSIKASNAKAVIYGEGLKKAIEDISDKLNIKLYQFGARNDAAELLEGATDLEKEIESELATSPTDDINEGKSKEKILFIYTSGTTGLPKAAVITNMRFAFMVLGSYYMAAFNKHTIFYCPLPLYHSAGGILGIGQCLLMGCTVVIRKKFSASNFWKDCAKYQCTAAQYIGEICRYILQAHSNNDKPIAHGVKKIIGNGLRPQIWKQFVDKFKIKEVYEFYGATEGNSNLINIDNKLGAVGFVPQIASALYPVALVKCDEATGEPIRRRDGFCQRCQIGEAGVLVGIVDAKKTINEFSGYADEASTKKKILRNVFKTGDVYFNSGDVLVQDEFGYFYFKDRTGDTFRWKGENVATSEIEAVISNVVNLSDAVVYGVEIPDIEGRAGMAAIVDSDQILDMSKLCKGLKENLPSYAIPVFIRVVTSVPLTGTFKLKKTDLQKDGFNVDKIKDKLYLYDAKNVTYVDLTKDKYDDIMSGKIKL